MTTDTPPIIADDDQYARAPRTAKLLAVELSSERFNRTRVVVRNISAYGLGARADLDLLPLEHVTVHLPNGVSVGAVVRWVRKGVFGLSLDERIDPTVVQVGTASAADLTTRDAKVEFRIPRPVTQGRRSGFQRSHRDEILGGSRWTNKS